MSARGGFVDGPIGPLIDDPHGPRDRVLRERQQRAAVVAEALTWLGTPWRHAARVKGAGVDCGMFLAEVFERAGIAPHVDPGPYPRDWHMHRDEERYLAILETYLTRTAGPPLPGDVALYRFGRCAAHGAIVVEWPQIVHAYVPVGKVVLDDAEANQALVPRFVGFWTAWVRS